MIYIFESKAAFDQEDLTIKICCQIFYYGEINILSTVFHGEGGSQNFA